MCLDEMIKVDAFQGWRQWLCKYCFQLVFFRVFLGSVSLGFNGAGVCWVQTIMSKRALHVVTCLIFLQELRFFGLS